MRNWSRLIETDDAMDASDMELRRMRYDFRLSEHIRPADQKVPPNPRVAGLTTAIPDTALHMRQEDRGGVQKVGTD